MKTIAAALSHVFLALTIAYASACHVESAAAPAASHAADAPGADVAR